MGTFERVSRSRDRIVDVRPLFVSLCKWRKKDGQIHSVWRTGQGRKRSSLLYSGGLLIKKKGSAKKRYLWLSELDFVSLFWFLPQSEKKWKMLDFKLEFNLWTLKAVRAGHNAKNYLKQSHMFRASGYFARNSAQTTLYLQGQNCLFRASDYSARSQTRLYK